jgi:acyltransferase
MAEVKRRSVAIDLVRVLAIIAVVLRHDFYDPKGVIAQIVCPWAIAIFFVLSGYLWSSRHTFRDEVNNRARGLLIPYFAWVPLISIPYFAWAFPHYGFKYAFRLLIDAGYGGGHARLPFSACWFFTVMFFAVIFMRYLERYSRRVTWVVVIASVAVSATVPLLLWFSPLGFTLALPCMLFILLGQEFRKVRARITQPLVTGVVVLAAGIVMVLMGATHNTKGVLIEIKAATFGYPVFGLLAGVVISIGVILIAEAIEHLIPDGIRQHITTAATTATFVMFLHPCIILMLNTPRDGRLPDFFVALLVPVALALLCLKLHIFPWLTGEQKQKPVAMSAAEETPATERTQVEQTQVEKS